MPIVDIEPKLYSRVEEVASESKTSIDEILTEAVRRYLWELDRRKISEESHVYRQQHADLKANYLGQYIAMHNGEVVDHNQDFQTLHERIRQRFGNIPVMITLVDLELNGLRLPNVFVVGDEQGDEIVLGRNIINKLRLFFDGPNKITDIRSK